MKQVAAKVRGAERTGWAAGEGAREVVEMGGKAAAEASASGQSVGVKEEASAVESKREESGHPRR